MMNQNINYKQNNTVNFLLVLCSVCIALIPRITREIPTLWWGIIVLLWYIDIVVKKGRVQLYKGIVILFVWFAWCTILRLIGHSTAASGNYFLLLASIDFYAKAIYIFENYTNKEKKRLFVCIQIIVLAVVVYNLLMWVNNPSGFDYFNYRPENYIGTNKIESSMMYHFLVFFIGINFYLYKKQYTNKILCFLSFLLPLLFVFFVNPRAIVLLLLLLFIFIIVMNINKENRIKSISIFVLILVILVVLFIFKDTILNVLPARLQPRVRSIFLMLSGQDYDIAGSSLSSRVKLQINSLETFFGSFGNFIYGAGLHLGQDYYGTVGQHAWFTDYLACYGIIGLYFLVLMFTKVRKEYLSHISSNSVNELCRYIWIVFFISGLVCNSFKPQTCLAVFLIPALLENGNIDEQW